MQAEHRVKAALQHQSAQAHVRQEADPHGRLHVQDLLQLPADADLRTADQQTCCSKVSGVHTLLLGHAKLDTFQTHFPTLRPMHACLPAMQYDQSLRDIEVPHSAVCSAI